MATVLLGCAPKDVAPFDDVTDAEAEATKILKTPAFVGRGPKMMHVAFDYQGIGSIRAITHGTLKVVTMSAEELGKVGGENKISFLDQLTSCLYDMTEETLNTLFSKKPGSSLRGCFVGAGSMLYLPTGCVVAERVLNSEMVFGVRLSAVCKAVGLRTS